ncbi:class I SAM-dependent methyltransferase [Streptacidiphilus sp. ASG 303]|uniref:class I SAM-dependent methyltransferase n=1 Tax=Streptomycetaceae TaxID=2062 RepID=UPI001E3DAF02|nr:class I SAM-dependent methyltransferase [Streptacidiphilus sp. ASG 303]MCD0481265.1 methyltransferase domain-containing protein [Streptacidiphilus sp. ASG 303]
MTVHQAAGTGYQRAADAYERSRPSYPLPALRGLADAVGLEPGRTVVDLGAGTGKFTRLLALTGARVVALEPVAAMRGRLAELLPGVEVGSGTAEATGLPDASADVVVAAQAWHWFRQEEALAEVERVLRPGGSLALVWNTFDDSVPWVRDFQRIYFGRAPEDLPSHLDGRWRTLLEARPGWSPVEELHLPNPHPVTREGVLERMASSSIIAALDAAEQERVRAEVDAVLRAHPQTRDGDRVELPYTTDVYWTRRA